MAAPFFIHNKIMKKLFLLAFAMCLSTSAINAQVFVGNSNEQVTTTKKVSKTSIAGIQEQGAKKEDKINSSWDFSYLFVEDGWGLGLDLVANHFNLGFNYAKGDETDYLKNNSSWSLSMGYNGRYWLAESFYIEARGGVQYGSSSYEMVTGTKQVTKTIGYGSNKKTYTTTVNVWEEESDSSFGLYLNPRIGLAFGKSVAVTAGYEWNFNDFKFDKEHTSDYFTLGLSFLF